MLPKDDHPHLSLRKRRYVRNMYEAIEMHIRSLLEDRLPVPESHSSAEFVAFPSEATQGQMGLFGLLDRVANDPLQSGHGNHIFDLEVDAAFAGLDGRVLCLELGDVVRAVGVQ